MSKIQSTIIGAGNMGTAIAQVIAKNGFKVNLWNHEGDKLPLEQIIKYGENKKYFKGIKLSKNINPVFDLNDALSGSQIVFFVIPSNFMSDMVKRVIEFLPCGVVCVDASKGIDDKSLFIVTELMKRNIPKCLQSKIVSISGPAIAHDMALGRFTAMNVASKNKQAINLVKKVMENKNLKLVPTDDLIGVELTGSFKNVYAIAMGICDGLKMPMNTKSALLVTALREISELVEKMGGKSQTVYDLAGLGDLVGTGLCEISRNRRFGEYLAEGLKKDDAIKKVGQVVEGVSAVKILIDLNKKYKVNMPFAKMVYEIVISNKPVKKQFLNFLENYK